MCRARMESLTMHAVVMQVDAVNVYHTGSNVYVALENQILIMRHKEQPAQNKPLK